MSSTVPDLSELAQVIGPINGIEPLQTRKPLCENIFDVQRSELFDVLERLRSCFWSDELVVEPVQDSTAQASIEENNIAPASETINLKRAREPDLTSGEDEYLNREVPKKRIRHIDTKPATVAIDKKADNALYSRQSTLVDFAALWPTKLMLIREIKTPACKEKELVRLLSSVRKTHSRIQCHHLSSYLIPVAKAMRKQSVVELLSKWICN